MSDCIFCKIVNGELPSTKLYEDDKVLAFKDINPETPVHFLVIPKKHISGVDEITEENADVVAHIFVVINKITSELGISKDGYRVISNVGENGGQTVRHLHYHVLGGEKLGVKLT